MSDRTITVVHPGSLGDVLLAIPALRGLRASFPGHGLGLVAASEVGGLLRACGEVDVLFPSEGSALSDLLSEPGAGGTAAAQGLRAWLDCSDAAVCWMADQDGKLVASLRGRGLSHIVVRSPVSSPCRATHQADRFLETVQDVVGAKGRDAPLRLPDAVVAEAQGALDAAGLSREASLVAVHPGSGSLQKCSEASSVVRVIEGLRRIGLVPLVVGGPADDAPVEKVLAACADTVKVFRRESVLSMAGLLAQARLFIGHDSGLTHLAAALAVPVVALFGPTDRERWAPRGLHVDVLSGGPCLCREQGWQSVGLCHEKPCLKVAPEAVLEAAQATLHRQAVALQMG